MGRMSSGALGVAGASTLLLMSALAGCSHPSIDTSCDVAGVTTEIHHVVGEAGLDVGSIDSVECESEWTYVRATIVGPDTPSTSETYLFRVDGGMLVLTFPETVCESTEGDGTGLPVMPKGLHATICPA